MAGESTEEKQEAQTFHGGRLIARRLKAHGVKVTKNALKT